MSDIPQLPVLIVPGKGGSEPAHWQSWLETQVAGCRRVEQANWDNPELLPWARRVARQAQALADEYGAAPLLVAHSFGCLAGAYAALHLGAPVAAGLYVAPANPARFGIPRSALAWPLPRHGQQNDLIASTNDPWMKSADAAWLAEAWGARFQLLEGAGHINVAAGFGPWELPVEWIVQARQKAVRAAAPGSRAPGRSGPSMLIENSDFPRGAAPFYPGGAV